MRYCRQCKAIWPDGTLVCPRCHAATFESKTDGKKAKPITPRKNKSNREFISWPKQHLILMTFATILFVAGISLLVYIFSSIGNSRISGNSETQVAEINTISSINVTLTPSHSPLAENNNALYVAQSFLSANLNVNYGEFLPLTQYGDAFISIFERNYNQNTVDRTMQIDSAALLLGVDKEAAMRSLYAQQKMAYEVPWERQASDFYITAASSTYSEEGLVMLQEKNRVIENLFGSYGIVVEEQEEINFIVKDSNDRLLDQPDISMFKVDGQWFVFEPFVFISYMNQHE